LPALLFGKEIYEGEFGSWTKLFKALMVVSMALGCKIQPFWLNLAVLGIYLAVLIQTTELIYELVWFAVIALLALRQVRQDMPRFFSSAATTPTVPPKALHRSKTPSKSTAIEGREAVIESKARTPVVERASVAATESPTVSAALVDSPLSKDLSVAEAKRTAKEKMESRQKARVDELLKR